MVALIRKDLSGRMFKISATARVELDNRIMKVIGYGAVLAIEYYVTWRINHL